MSHSSDMLDAVRYACSQPAFEPSFTVTKKEETDKGLMVYVTCNPIKPDWLDEHIRKLGSNPCWKIMKEEKLMTKSDIEYFEKRGKLEQDHKATLTELETEYTLKKAQETVSYEEALYNLEHEHKQAKFAEEAKDHAEMLKATYDSYIKAGFTKAQADTFLALVLKKGTSDGE